MTHTQTIPPAAPTAEAPVPKPLLRGWLHLVSAPLFLVAGLVFTAFAPTLEGRIGCAVYTLAAVNMFATSATYHRGRWSDRRRAVFRRWDHSNIFVFIAGTYTPLALTLLEGTSRTLLLTLIWGLALSGVLFRTLWLGAPRWLYTAMYIAMGWVAVWWLPQLWAAGGPAVVILVIAGGLVYTLGAVAYGSKRPDPWPSTFGFHELFHACTIAAAVLHLTAIGLAIFAQ